jgi:hypothetical protein
VNVVVVFAMSVGVVNAILFALCHFVTEPTLPVKVNAATVPPEQILWLLLTNPPAETGLTVINADDELSDTHVPLVTTAL